MPLWTRKTATDHTVADGHDLKAAYEKGRRDERASRKRHPFLMGGLFVLAAVGASLITLAAINGSFSGGGEVADQNLVAAAERATPVLQGAAARTGEAARDAGTDLKEKGRDLVTNDTNG